MLIIEDTSAAQVGWRPSLLPPDGVLPSISPPAHRSERYATAAEALPALQKLRDRHEFWNTRLLQSCAEGGLSKEDFKFIFSQYYFYSRNFTRYISAAMANCDDDFYRSRLTANLWEEGGEKEIEKRHAQIFRRFLRDGLGIDVNEIVFLDCTKNFVREFLSFCLHSHPMASSAFLSLGTEGIVARMYSVMVEGLLKAGVEEPHLEFFRIHIGCDDDHAETLEKMMCSYFDEPDWFNTCVRATEHGLSLRQQFFDNLIDALPHERVKRLIANVQSEEATNSGPVVHRKEQSGKLLYHNLDTREGLEFARRAPAVPGRGARPARGSHPRWQVQRAPQARPRNPDPRDHRQWSSRNRRADHRDQGGGHFYVPRWTMHRVHNTGTEALSYFAVTDFGFASKVHQGDYLEGHRQKPENDRSFNA